MARNPIIRESLLEAPTFTDETPHGCYEGFVYLGHMVEDESGDEAELIERVPCRRCNAAGDGGTL